jgi:hypothetical protein
MSGREQEPWQRAIRRAREQGSATSWEIAPGVDAPRRYPAQPIQPPEPEPPRQVSEPFPLATDERVWAASASFGKLIGVVLIAVATLLLMLALWRVSVTDGTPRLLALGASLLLALAVVGLVFLQRSLHSMRYVLGSDHLTIAWAGERHKIPFTDIGAVTYDPRGDLRARGYERFWPGYYVSVMQMRDGVWHSVATQEPGRRVRLTTPAGIFAISPERPVLFLSELARRRQGLGADDDTEQRVGRESHGAVPARGVRLPSRPIMVPTERPRPITGPLPVLPDDPPSAPSRPVAPLAQLPQQPARSSPPAVRRSPTRRAVTGDWLFVYRHLFRERLLGDQIASGLVAVGVMLPLLMVAYLYSQYEGIPSVIPLHWNAHGEADLFGTRRDLWRLPLIAVVILVLNTTLATVMLAVDRFLARFLTAATPVAQTVTFIALIRAVN